VVSDVRSGQTTRLFQSQLVTGYDLGPDDRVLAAVRDETGKSQIWIGWLDGREAPRPVPNADGDNPRFAGNGTILFRSPEQSTAYMYRMKEDGTNRERVFESPATVFGTVSPDGQWVSRIAVDNSGMELVSKDREIRVFPYTSTSRIRWTLDGKRVYLSTQYGQASAFGLGWTFLLPTERGSVLPIVPPNGFRSETEISALPGVETFPYGDLALGSSPGVYVYSKIATTRNLFRIPLQ
jgi:hypothetical protein